MLPDVEIHVGIAHVIVLAGTKAGLQRFSLVGAGEVAPAIAGHHLLEHAQV